MKLNSLFGAITHHLLKKPTYKVLELSIPELALTKDEQQYYRVNLTPLNICVNDFYLTEAHVSIYKMVQVDNPVLGPSHFTALFSNSAGQTFRMHLFLNSFDNISCPPTWELWDEKEGFVKADTPEFIDYLKQQLWQLGFPYVHELRRIQVELEHSFNEEYKTLEKQLSALSINLHENIDAYLNLLDDTLLLVKRLIEVSDTQHWYRIEIYLQKIKESLLSEIEKSEDSELVDPPPELNNMHVDNQLKVNNKNTLSSIPQRLFAKTKATPILERAVENKIQQIKNLFEKLRTTSDDQMQAIFLVDLYHKMLAIDLENGDVLSTSQLNELVQIESKFSQLAKTLLHKALLGKQFDLARCLSPFYNYISLDILKLALMNKNSQVLDFLVNEVQLPMNRYPLVIKNKTYANAVSYLFSEYDGNNSSMDCLNVLIVDEGSLMQPMDPMGLPFAHMLLSSEPKHPLWAILEQNKSISLDNRHFYTHLILELKQYLKMNYPDPELSMQIHHWIRNYEESCQTIKVQHNILNSRNRALLDEFSNISKTTLSTAMVDALHMDSDIKRENSYLMNELNQAIIRLKQFKRVTGKEFAYHTLVHSYTSELKDQLLKSDLKIELGFSELKYQILVYMDNVRTLIRTVIELLDVQTDILKTPQILGKRNKTYKKLQVDQTELLKKINDLNEKMPLAILKKCNDLKIAIEILDRKEQEYNNRLKLFENLLAHLQDEGEEYTDENYEAILNSLLDQSISSPGP